jgi:hypothetical protein
MSRAAEHGSLLLNLDSVSRDAMQGEAYIPRRSSPVFGHQRAIRKIRSHRGGGQTGLRHLGNPCSNETPPDMPSLEEIKHLVCFGDGYKKVENPGPTYPSAPVFNNLLQRSAEFDKAFGYATHERCLYMTREGFIGLGPLSTKPSDQVWILQAAKVPFILRPMDNYGRFNLVGETYVHGFMNREFAGAGTPHGWMEIDLV